MSSIAHPAQVDSILRIAQSRCHDLGISVRFDWQAQTASTDGRNIILPQLAQPVTVEQLDLLYGQIIHETGHHLRSDAFKIMKRAKPPRHLCALYNIVEDEGMERERALEWRGDAKGLSVMNRILIKQLDDKWQEAATLEAEDGQDPAPLAALSLNQIARLSWDPDSDVVAQHAIDHMPDHVKNLTGELIDEGWVEKLRDTKDPHDTWNLAVDLAKRLYPDDEEEQQEYEEIRDAGNDESGPQRDDSNSKFKDAQSCSQSKEGGEQGTAEGKDTDGEGDATELGDGEGRTVSWEDCVLSEHNEWSKDRPGGLLGITWGGKPPGNVKLAPTNKINVIELSKSQRKTHHRDYGRTVSSDNFMPNDEANRAFASKIRRYIQAQARSVVRKEREHGNIDRGNLYRLAMPAIDGGNWNKKIFYDQRKHTMQDTAIFVLVDWSGSMIGRKMEYAAEAAQRLIHTFDKVLHIPVACAAFTDRDTFCDIGYVKRFTERNMQASQIADNFAKFYYYTCGNNDGDSVNWAYQEILKRKEARKILIVISDGAPAGSWAGADYHSTLQYITKHIEADPRVDLYGVGLMNNSVENYYSNYQVVKCPEDITPALFNVIKDGDKR